MLLNIFFAEITRLFELKFYMEYSVNEKIKDMILFWVT